LGCSDPPVSHFSWLLKPRCIKNEGGKVYLNSEHTFPNAWSISVTLMSADMHYRYYTVHHGGAVISFGVALMPT